MDDSISRQAAIETRRYTFGNDEFSLEDAYHDCKLVFDGITDDDSFQEADTGLILYYANEIIYALQKALEGKDTNVTGSCSEIPNNSTLQQTCNKLATDCISRQAAIAVADSSDYLGLSVEDVKKVTDEVVKGLKRLPSAQPDLCDGCDRYGASCVGEGCGKLEISEVAKDTNVPANDCISRQAAIDALDTIESEVADGEGFQYAKWREYFCDLPSTQPEPMSESYMKAVWTWLLDYQIKTAELKGRYTPYEVLSWVANDWRKEHE